MTRSDIVDWRKKNIPNCKAKITPEIEGVEVEIRITMIPPTMHNRKVRMVIRP